MFFLEISDLLSQSRRMKDYSSPGKEILSNLDPTLHFEKTRKNALKQQP